MPGQHADWRKITSWSPALLISILNWKVNRPNKIVRYIKMFPIPFHWLLLSSIPSSNIMNNVVKTNWGKCVSQVLDIATRILDNARPFLPSSIELLYNTTTSITITFLDKTYTPKNVPVFTNTGTLQYLGPRTLWLLQHHHHHHHPSAAEEATTRFLHTQRSSANAAICCSGIAPSSSPSNLCT